MLFRPDGFELSRPNESGGRDLLQLEQVLIRSTGLPSLPPTSPAVLSVFRENMANGCGIRLSKNRLGLLVVVAAERLEVREFVGAAG